MHNFNADNQKLNDIQSLSTWNYNCHCSITMTIFQHFREYVINKSLLQWTELLHRFNVLTRWRWSTQRHLHLDQNVIHGGEPFEFPNSLPHRIRWYPTVPNDTTSFEEPNIEQNRQNPNTGRHHLHHKIQSGEWVFQMCEEKSPIRFFFKVNLIVFPTYLLELLKLMSQKMN